MISKGEGHLDTGEPTQDARSTDVEGATETGWPGAVWSRAVHKERAPNTDYAVRQCRMGGEGEGEPVNSASGRALAVCEAVMGTEAGVPQSR